jgi:putative glutathione S-transferase
MGQLIDGVWEVGWYGSDAKGAFHRPKTQFRSWVVPPAGPRAASDEGVSLHVAEPGRYHLYASYACPWAHRALITRSIRGLEDVVGLTIVDPKMGDDGWAFGGDGEPDVLFGAKLLREVYLRASSHYSGRVTVPALWDRKLGTIVNNESREVMRMLDTSFDDFARDKTSLAPEPLRPAIDHMLDSIYTRYNNGVYRAGFATQQGAYERACHDVFATLDRCEAILAKQRFLCGDVFTEADVAFFTTSLRFDLVYYSHFKCNVRRLRDYPNVWGFVRDVYQMPAVKRVCRLDQIKVHYYWSQTTINPSRIIPLGPTLDLYAPHGRS